jgi:hypothetical protein
LKENSTTARQKMPLAMKLSNCDLGVASEGSLVLTLLYLLQVQMMFLIFIDTKTTWK